MAEKDTQEPRMHGGFLLDLYDNIQRTGALIIVGGMVFLIVAMAISVALAPQPAALDTGKVGVHLLLDDGRNDWPLDVWDAHLEAAAQIAAPQGIVVQVIRGDDLDPQRWQNLMDLSTEHNLTPVLRLATTFDFSAQHWNAPIPDGGGGYASYGVRYADFLNALDWPQTEKHVILLNEPNNGHEWGGKPDPAAYARFVVDVVAVLRQRVPDVVILNAAFDLHAPHTGSDPFPDTDSFMIDANSFMDAMQAAQPAVFAQFDIWNSHVYPLNGFRSAPQEQAYQFDFMGDAVDTTTPPPDGITNRGVNSYTWALWKLEQLGADSLPVMITETGWRHAESVDMTARDGGADYPSAATVAQYLDVAMRGAASPYAEAVPFTPWLADERVIAVAPFALNGVPWEWGHSNLLQMSVNGDITGTYPAFDLLAGYHTHQG